MLPAILASVPRAPGPAAAPLREAAPSRPAGCYRPGLQPAGGRLPLRAFLVDSQQPDRAGCGVVDGTRRLGDEEARLAVQAGVLQDDPAVVASQVVGVRQPHVDGGDAAGGEMGGERGDGRRLSVAVTEQEQRVQGDERQPVVAGLPEPDVERIADLEAEAGRGPRSGARSTTPRPLEHRRIAVDAGDRVAGAGERHGQATGADRQLEDRAAGPIGEGGVQVEIARVVGEVQVVEAGERRRLRRRTGRPGAGSGDARWVPTVAVHASGQPGAPWNRTARPAAFLTASALMVSMTARLAAIAVCSA